MQMFDVAIMNLPSQSHTLTYHMNALGFGIEELDNVFEMLNRKRILGVTDSKSRKIFSELSCAQSFLEESLVWRKT
jgi:hypothetical protein